jgi:hypothetical protein
MFGDPHIMQLPVSHVDQEEYEENPTSLAIIYQVCHLINLHIYILLRKSSFFEGIMMLRYHAVGAVDHQQGGPGSGCRGRFGCHGSGRKEEPRQLFVAPGARQFVGS